MGTDMWGEKSEHTLRERSEGNLVCGDSEIARIMWDDDPGGTPVMDRRDIGYELRKKSSIQIGSWLIHDEDSRTMEECSDKSDSLPLSCREWVHRLIDDIPYLKIRDKLLIVSNIIRYMSELGEERYIVSSGQWLKKWTIDQSISEGMGTRSEVSMICHTPGLWWYDTSEDREECGLTDSRWTRDQVDISGRDIQRDIVEYLSGSESLWYVLGRDKRRHMREKKYEYDPKL
jgi:hypothetical protein